MTPDLLLIAALDGIAYAALVFLVAVGLTLIFGVLRVLNIAHGSLYAVGAYAAASLSLWLGAANLSPWLTFPAMLIAACVVGIVLGTAIERMLLQQIYDKEEVLQLLATFAVFMILDNAQRMIWGVQPYFAAGPLKLLGNVNIGPITYTSYQIILLPAIAVVVLLGLRTFLRHTTSGRVILAVAEDREAARAIGINVSRVYLSTFVIGAILAALGGSLASPTTSILPGMGTDMLVLSFAVAATAGLGRIEGAAITALMIGLGRSIAVYTAPEFDVLVPYLTMSLVLLFRPHGLFGTFQARRI
ncbi:MAG: branched-chain amino acid ABC transporter permease [Pseudomonadota bacterium]